MRQNRLKNNCLGTCFLILSLFFAIYMYPFPKIPSCKLNLSQGRAPTLTSFGDKLDFKTLLFPKTSIFPEETLFILKNSKIFTFIVQFRDDFKL